MDRVLAGVGMSDDSQAWIGWTVPLDDVGSSRVELAGRLAEFVDRLTSVVEGEYTVGMEPEESRTRTFERYEDVARYLLDRFRDELGLELVEGKQSLPGRSGATWTIEAKGVEADTGKAVVIECRRKTTRKINQEEMGAIANRITDLGAAGGIVVTPIGLQKGAQLVAKHNNIELVRLNKDATPTDFMMNFLENAFAGRSASFSGTGTLTAKAEAVQPDEPAH